MVDVNSIYMSLSTIAVVTEVPPRAVTFDETWIKQILSPPLSLGPALVGPALFSSHRDQIEVFASDTKINVRDLSGKTEFSDSKIPPVLHAFLDRYDVQIKSYGVNFVITNDYPAAGEWVRDNILQSGISEKTDKEILGGSATLKVRSDPKTWTVVVEVPEDNKLSWNFNASENISPIPDETRLRQDLQEQFEGFLQFLTQLGL